MPIYLNGGSNPSAVTYNNTSLTRVYASIGGSSALVWGGGSGSPFPSSLSQLHVTIADGVDCYIRDSTFVRDEGVYNPSTGVLALYGYYSCDISLELQWPRYSTVGAAYYSPVEWRPTEDGTPTCQGSLYVTGLSSGFAFDKLSKDSRVNLDFLRTEDGSYSPDGPLTRISADCDLELLNAGNGQGRTAVFVYCSAGNYALYAPSTGVITQGASTLRIRKL